MSKRLLLVVSVMLAALLVLAACGGDEEPTPAAQPAAQEEAKPTDTPAPEPTKAEEPTKAPEASAAVTTTETVTTTEAVTVTEAMTATEAVTATQEVTGTEAMTGTSAAPASGEAIKAEKGKAVKMTLLPKFVGIAVFDEANQGAQEAHKELENPEELIFTGPTAEKSVEGQIETVTNAPTQGQQAIMISNNAGEQIIPAAKAAKDAGLTVVTWDSPIPSAEGEDVFIAQVDFDETGKVMADMALSILGEDGGKFAILSASPDAANQNAWIAAMNEALKDPKYSKLELLDTVYGNDQSEESYKQALALVDKYPDMELIMAPTSVGIVAAAKAMTDEELCDKVKVSGLGLPSEMKEYTLSGCAPEFALWSFVDLGYLTYYTTYLIATGQMEAKDGATFEAGRMGTYTITKDPTRENGLRVLMGPFSIYNKDNVE
jgi:rhamnose transport system substrate-binding protein